MAFINQQIGAPGALESKMVADCSKGPLLRSWWFSDHKGSQFLNDDKRLGSNFWSFLIIGKPMIPIFDPLWSPIFDPINWDQCTKLEHAPAWKIIENVGTWEKSAKERSTINQLSKEKKHPRSFRRSHCVAELSSFPSLIFSAILRGSPKIVTNVFVGVEKTQLQDVI